jgi:uncharacterized membrane protein
MTAVDGAKPNRVRGRLRTRSIARSGVLSAITILLGWTHVGFIPVPTPAGAATVLHVPAILAGVLEGPVAGFLVGLMFGLFSFLQASIPMFKDPIVAILPRLIIGVTAAYAYRILGKAARAWVLASGLVGAGIVGVFGWQVGVGTLWLGIVVGMLALALAIGTIVLALREDRERVAIGLAAVAGTLTNTVLVLTLGVLRGYLPDFKTAAFIAVTHGVPEIAVAVIVTLAVALAWKRVERAGGGARL